MKKKVKQIILVLLALVVVALGLFAWGLYTAMEYGMEVNAY